MLRQLRVLRNRLRGYADIASVRLPLDRALISPPTERSFARQTYERPEATLVRGLIRPGDTVLELGAGLGFISAFVRRHTEAGRIVTYDANPAIIAYIGRMHALNVIDDIEVRHAVVMAEPSGPTVAFYIAPEFYVSSLEPAPGCRKVEVQTERLDEVLAEVRPDVLMLDIEGGEGDLLEADSLDPIRSVAVELHGPDMHERGLRAMQRHGFVAAAEPIGNVHAFRR
jgi:FkbM family methyltransferase